MKKNIRSSIHKFWIHLPFVFFIVAILCLCFTYGVVVGKWHVFPYAFLDAGWDSLTGWDSLKDLQGKLPHHFYPARYEGEGVVVCERDRIYPGVTLLTGPWKDGDDWNLGLRLIDIDGNVLHEWQCNPRDIWAHSPHSDRATGSKDHKTKTFIHGALLLSGGDVIFNLEHFGLVRLNSRSEVVWKLPYRTHHSVFQDDDGSFWVCGEKWRENYVPEFVGLIPPIIEDMILKVSSDGVIEREISVLETIYRSGYHGLLFFSRNYNQGDVLHLNDVEVLKKDKSEAFKDIFKAGDIMVSMRHINSVFVIDGETERIKWSLTYPFIRQHDPDFTKDGYITVFDNHDIKKSTPEMGHWGSRILRVEPFSRQVTVLYGHKKNQYFFTDGCGKHQHLPNGNMLITEAQAGRVFEITSNDEVVWSWIVPRWDENNVPEISEGTRYSWEFAAFLMEKRENKK